MSYGVEIKMLELKNLQYKYKDSMFFDFSFKLQLGESLALIGLSGSGKTTLLNLIAGFITPIDGELLFESNNITKVSANNRPVNMLFQEHNIFNHLNVFDNVALGISPGLKISKIERKLVEHALEKVGLGGFNVRLPHQLSGGQKQKLAISRALVRKKPILLLDEAFSSLDPPMRVEMLDLVKSLQKEHSLTMIMATHNYREAVHRCDKICFIDNGRILHIDNAKDFDEKTKNPTIKAYISCL